MTSFIPFANEADVRQIGGLQVENRLDRVTLSGDVDLTLDQQGLAHARELQRIVNDIVARLEAAKLPAALPAAKRKQVDNPFA